MFDLTGFQRDLLYVIAGLDEPHGLAIKDDEDYYEKEIHHGRLYPNPDTLVEKGLVEKGTLDQRVRPALMSSTRRTAVAISPGQALTSQAKIPG